AAPLASGGLPSSAEVLIANGVSISSVREEDGGMTTIERGTIPFYVDAPGSRKRGKKSGHPRCEHGTLPGRHNSITCEWAVADAEGIGVFSQLAPDQWSMQS